jgi:hypothetical protein
MDIEALRKQYLAEIQEASPPPETSAAEVADYAASADANEAKMCEMIATLPLDRDRYGEGVRALLDILANDGLPTEPRLCALRQLSAAEFEPKEFAPFHAEFIALLRRLALHAAAKIRLAAFERLTLTNDPEAQKLLHESLEKVRKPLVSAAKAVQLLARDDHGSGLEIFRTLAANAAGKVREQALRALASDTKSAALFEALAANKDESSAIRQIAAVNLKNTSAARFAKVARKLILDDEDDDRLRAAAVSAVTHTREVAAQLATPRFANALKSLGEATKSRTLRSSIRRFAERHGK